MSGVYSVISGLYDGDIIYIKININYVTIFLYYRRETGRQPIIVVDGSSCLRHLYGSLEWILGGQLKEFADEILKFVKAFESLGAKLVFFYDGVTVERKRPVWIERRLRSLQDVYKIFDCLNKWKRLSTVDQSLFILPPGLATSFFIKEVCNCEVTDVSYYLPN